MTETLNICYRLSGNDVNIDKDHAEADVAIVGYGSTKEKTMMQ